MDIKSKNQEFIQKLENNRFLKDKRDFLVNGQHPEILVICCSDSRVIPEEILSSSLGDIFVIRTAGNVINEGELATISYAINHLHINHILVMGHTHCGAIHSVIHNESLPYLDPIAKRIKHNIGDISIELEASKINAIKEAQYIKEKFPEYKGKIEYQIYDIETSLLTK